MATTTKRIVCTEQSNPPAAGHGHIIAVGIGDNPGNASSRETVTTVRANLASGQVYYTYSPSTAKVALVYAYNCACGVKTIRSAPDAVYDNNLDNLRLCNFS
jgi:hypothetical protein